MGEDDEHVREIDWEGGSDGEVHHQLLGLSELTVELVKQAADERMILSR